MELARAADAVLLVARGASTPFEVAQRTKAAFSRAVLGFVLNDVKDLRATGSYNYNYYYHARPEGGSRTGSQKSYGSQG